MVHGCFIILRGTKSDMEEKRNAGVCLLWRSGNLRLWSENVHWNKLVHYTCKHIYSKKHFYDGRNISNLFKFEDVGGGLKSNMHVGNFPWPFLDKTWCNIKQLLLVFKCYCLSFVNTKWFHHWNSDEPCAYFNFWSDCAFLLLVLNY